jgi:predicted flap endonuclease-1-like 5' DNA nuclease
MALIPGLVLLLLGLAIGFIIAWAFGIFSAGFSTGLVVGLILLIAGMIVGFVLEWLIDEAYRKNRELQRQLREHDDTAIKLAPASPPIFNETIEDSVPQALSPSEQTAHTASENLAIYWRHRDEELQEIQRQLTYMNAETERLRLSFESYQRTHPDNLTLIKGIGPVFQWKLRDIGISTYEQLATADPAQVRRQLDIKKWQRVNIEAWVEQARDWVQRES